MMNMRYVDRDKNGNITGTFAREQYEGQEYLPESDTEIQVFVDGSITDELTEEKIQVEMATIIRATAIQNLKDRGELAIDYMELSR